MQKRQVSFQNKIVETFRYTFKQIIWKIEYQVYIKFKYKFAVKKKKKEKLKKFFALLVFKCCKTKSAKNMRCY